MSMKDRRFSGLKFFDQKGMALPLALVSLALGVLLLTPLLASVGTNLSASQAADTNMKKQYAADAGVEYAIWKLSHDADFRDALDSSPTVVITAPTTVNGIVLTATVTLVGGDLDYAIFANSQSCSPAVKISGSGDTIEGKIHSNNDVKVTGSGHIFNGIVEFYTTFKETGSGHTYNPPPPHNPVQAPLRDMPALYSLADYSDPTVQGTPAWEADQLGQYYHHTGDLTFSGSGTEYPTGLYYVEGDVKISGSGHEGTVTIVAEGDINISGSGHSFTPYCDKLLFFSNEEYSGAVKCNRGVVKISGSGNVAFGGYIYAPHGKIDISGSGNMSGSFLGNTVELTGSGMHVTAPGSTSTPANYTAYDIRSSAEGATTTSRIWYGDGALQVKSWEVQ